MESADIRRFHHCLQIPPKALSVALPLQNQRVLTNWSESINYIVPMNNVIMAASGVDTTCTVEKRRRGTVQILRHSVNSHCKDCVLTNIRTEFTCSGILNSAVSLSFSGGVLEAACQATSK